MLLFCKIQIHYRRHKNSENIDLKKGKSLETRSHSKYYRKSVII